MFHLPKESSESIFENELRIAGQQISLNVAVLLFSINYSAAKILQNSAAPTFRNTLRQGTPSIHFGARQTFCSQPEGLEMLPPSVTKCVRGALIPVEDILSICYEV